jgi:peptide/nickel transport system permease protein
VRRALNRLGFFALTLWVAITLNFLLPRLMPGSPADAALAKIARRGPVDEGTRRAIEALLGVPTGSLWDQYVDYLGRVVRFDFGLSYSYYPQSVNHVVAGALPWTLTLVGSVTVISAVLGFALGTLAAWRRGTWLDSVPTLSSMAIAAFPYFWTALMLLYLLGYTLHWFPTSGAYGATTIPAPTWGFIGEAFWHGVLPAVTILLTSLGGSMIGMRNNVITTLGEDYVTFAEANGLHPRTIALRYGARNALLPSLTAFGLSLGSVVGGSLLVETVFHYPGMGLLLYNAVLNQDFPLMQACFLIITVSTLVANLIVDLVYGFLDPRTRRTA